MFAPHARRDWFSSSQICLTKSTPPNQMLLDPLSHEKQNSLNDRFACKTLSYWSSDTTSAHYSAHYQLLTWQVSRASPKQNNSFVSSALSFLLTRLINLGDVISWIACDFFVPREKLSRCDYYLNTNVSARWRFWEHGQAFLLVSPEVRARYIIYPRYT